MITDASVGTCERKRIQRRKLLLLGGGTYVLGCLGFMVDWPGLLGGNTGEVSDPPSHDLLPHELAYATFLDSIELEHLSASEIIRCHRRQRGAVCNSLPPQHLWQSIVPTLRIASAMRSELGAAVELRSVYRSPAYNAMCPGAAKFSQHLANRAADLAFACPPREAFRCASLLRSAGKFSGGIGLYKTFVHIDTRGYNATWGG